jgi:hypothetical protein
MYSRLFQRFAGMIAGVGSDPSDSDDVALQKRLAVSLSLAIVPLALVWSAIYLAVGAPRPSRDPMFF